MLSNLPRPADGDRRAEIDYMVSLRTDAAATLRKPPGRSRPGPRPNAASPDFGPASARAVVFEIRKTLGSGPPPTPFGARNLRRTASHPG